MRDRQAVGERCQKPSAAISQTITEFEFHISPALSSSSRHTAVSTVAKRSSSSPATRGSKVSQRGGPTVSTRWGIDPPRESAPRSETGATSRGSGSPRRRWLPRLGWPRRHRTIARLRSCSDHRHCCRSAGSVCCWTRDTKPRSDSGSPHRRAGIGVALQGEPLGRHDAGGPRGRSFARLYRFVRKPTGVSQTSSTTRPARRPDSERSSRPLASAWPNRRSWQGSAPQVLLDPGLQRVELRRGPGRRLCPPLSTSRLL